MKEKPEGKEERIRRRRRKRRRWRRRRKRKRRRRNRRYMPDERDTWHGECCNRSVGPLVESNDGADDI